MNNKFLVIGIIVVIFLIGAIYFANMDRVEVDDGMHDVSYMDVSAAEAKQLIDDNPEIIVIDVSPHYDNGHLPGAISYYPLSMLSDAIPTLDPNAMYLVYCHAGGPSRNGAQALIDAGFTNVYRLESHFGGWQAAGYEIEQ